MEPFQIALLVGAAFVAALSYKNPRGIYWIIAGSLVFYLGDYQMRHVGTFPGLANLFLDALFCIIIDTLRKHDWELALYRVFRYSCYLHIIVVVGLLPSQLIYVALIEAFNWLALLLILGNSLLELRGLPKSVRGPLYSCLCRFRATSCAGKKAPHWLTRWR